jgi:hypothetical protein
MPFSNGDDASGCRARIGSGGELPTDRPAAGEDFDRARKLFADRRRREREQQTRDGKS